MRTTSYNRGIRGVSAEEEKEGYSGKDLQKGGFKPGMKEWDQL